MLARDHRIVSGTHLRLVQRRGVRSANPCFVMNTLVTTSDSPARYGFVVAKSVGGAVVRNKVKRRLRALAALSLVDKDSGRDVVVRALPPAAHASFEDLMVLWDIAIKKSQR